MPPEPVKLRIEKGLAIVTLNDPAKRNALGLEMFDELERVIERICADQAIHVVLLHGEGAVFCAGFDLNAAVNDPSILSTYIDRLSSLNQSLRRMPQVVVVAVQGAAIAGGCAVLSACDFVVVAEDAKLGYPVHRIGISPAVTIPTLEQAVGSGHARELLMSGELINGSQAQRLGLASHLSQSKETVLTDALAICETLLAKGRHALARTKTWLNELDGSLDPLRFQLPAQASGELSAGREARQRLAHWQRNVI